MTMILTFLLLLFMTICPFLGTEKTSHAVGQQEKPIAVSHNTNVAGKVHGRTFTPDTVTLENGVLTLRQGKEFFADFEVQIFLPGAVQGSVPEWKSYVVNSDDSGNPLIWVAWTEEGNETTQIDQIWKGYNLELSFAQEETKGVLPGKIFLSIPGKVDTELRGTFSAEVRGKPVPTEKVDLTIDSYETLNEVAVRYLKKKHPGKRVNIDSQRDAALVKMPDGGRWGYADISYAVEGKRPIRTKLLFVKESNVWKIHQELSPNLIHQAHPVFPPDPTGYSDDISFAVAQRAEKDLNAEFPGKPVHGTYIDSTHMSEFATVDFSFKIEDFQKPMTKRYLLRLVGDYDWEVSRELGPNEQVNLQTGRSE